MTINMDALPFLPEWPPEVSPLAWIAVLLLAAILAGEVVRRTLRISRIVGYLAVGTILGPQFAGVVEVETLARLRIIVDIAVGLLLFELGQRADLTWCRRNPSLLAISVGESAASFLLVYLTMGLFGFSTVGCAAAGVLAIATSPAVTMTIVKDLRAQGQVTERTLLLAMLNTAIAVITAAIIVGLMHKADARPVQTMVAHPLYLVIGSLLLALVLAVVMLNVLRLFGRRPPFQFAVTVALVLLTVAMASTLRLSVPLALLILGVLARVLDRERHFVPLRFGETPMLFVILLFALAGATLEFHGWAAALPAALAFIVARFVGKLAPVMLLARRSHSTPRQSWHVSLALMPMSALSLLLLYDLTHMSRAMGEAALSSLYLSITIMAFAGTLAQEYALRRAGDAAEEVR